MGSLYTFRWLSAILGNPYLALAVLATAYFIVDQRYIGILPDVTKPFRRAKRIRQLRAEAERNPHNSAAMQELGLLLVERGEYKEAAERLSSALDRQPENAGVHLGLGMALYHLGRHDEGVSQINEAIGLSPRVGYGLPDVYLLMNQLRPGVTRDEALVADLGKRISSLGSPEILYRAGRAFSQAGDKEAAKRMYSTAVANYRCFPGRVRKLHRRWALAAWVHRVLG